MVMKAWAIYNTKTGEMKIITFGEECYPGFKSACDMSLNDWVNFTMEQNKIVESCNLILDELKKVI